MEDLIARFFGHLVGRLHGPLMFRLLMQPVTASILGVIAGVRDARNGRRAYGWALVREAGRRRRVGEGARAVAIVFTVAMLIDIVYQLIVFEWVYPGESVAVAIILAFLPYLAVRGPANRLASEWRRRKQEVNTNRIREIIFCVLSVAALARL